MRLSPDQTEFVRRLSELTGLDRGVLAAWVGTVSGWGMEHADHNYVGPPGAWYRSTDQAAHAVAAQLGPAARLSVPTGAVGQIAAIGNSPFNITEQQLADTWYSIGSRQAQQMIEERTGWWGSLSRLWVALWER